MFKRNLPLMVTIMVFVLGYLLCLASFPAFMSTRIICNILTDNAFLGIVAVGMTFVILSGASICRWGPSSPSPACCWQPSSGSWASAPCWPSLWCWCSEQALAPSWAGSSTP